MSDDAPAVFFAYPGQPALRVEVLDHASLLLKERYQFASRTWQDLPIEGRSIIGQILEAIRQADLIVADVGSLNSNVAFEVGYSLAQGKKLWLVLDETDTSATRAFADLALLRDVGYTNYSGNSEELVGSLVSKSPHLIEDTLWDDLLVDAQPRDARGMFYTGIPHPFKAAKDLDRLLARRPNLALSSTSGDSELGLAPLRSYVAQIYRSSAGLVHLLAPHRKRAAVINARGSLLAGILHGLNLPLLMVAEEGFVAPLDYQDLLYVYPTSRALQDHVDHWLEGLPTAGAVARAARPGRPGRLHLKTELAITSFGHYVAEYEADALDDYFIATGEYQTSLRSGTSVFVGRKGTGKSANMLQATSELQDDRRNLVVAIKPSSYELEGLVAVLSKLDARDVQDFFLASLWKYLLYTEVAITAVAQASARPAGIAVGSPLDHLRQHLVRMDVDVEDDFAVRLEKVVTRLRDALPDAVGTTVDTRSLINERLHQTLLASLRGKLGASVKDKDRVAVLIDNLDKAWERGADYVLLSRVILGLLTAVGTVERDFRRDAAWRDSVVVSLTVFLRADIYAVVASHAREPDKINTLQIEWKDPELLARVMEDRYAAARGLDVAGDAIWEELFAAEVDGVPTRDYLLWRALPRPRDLVYLGNSCLTAAINRRHDHVTADDVKFASEGYSQFALDALLVESDAAGVELEAGLYGLAGLTATTTAADFLDAFSEVPDAEAALGWLTQASFVGIEVREDEFEYCQGSEAARRAQTMSRRFSARLGRVPRVRVHPAFRPYLGIVDDDLR